MKDDEEEEKKRLFIVDLYSVFKRSSYNVYSYYFSYHPQ